MDKYLEYLNQAALELMKAEVLINKALIERPNGTLERIKQVHVDNDTDLLIHIDQES